jgi:hypothetical protein
MLRAVPFCDPYQMCATPLEQAWIRWMGDRFSIAVVSSITGFTLATSITLARLAVSYDTALRVNSSSSRLR